MQSGGLRGRGGSFSIPAVFVYAIWITVLGVATGDPGKLAVTALLTGLPGLLLGYRRFKLLVILIVFSLVGTFINMLLLYNTGDVVASIGPIVVREEAWRRTLSLDLRIVTLAGAGLLVSANISPRDAVRSLESELGLPRGLAFSLAFALRMLPLVYKDLQEVLGVRRMRGYRRIPLTPGDYRSLLMPLLSISIERGLWVGIAAELRGLSIRPRRRVRPRFKPMDLLLIALGVVQSLVVASLVGV